ncbi:MAG: hypothetical protein WAW37_20395 [Syntrophobacteraceae bacterium]
MRSLIIAPALLACLLLCTLSCDRGRDLAGKYTAVGPSGEGARLQLVLKGDGKGTWKLDREETSFTWEQRGSEVLLHAKTGGVIIGTLGKDDSIDISLPGMDSFHFTRTER